MRRSVRPVLRELALVAGLYVAYSMARQTASDDVGSALRHGRDLLALESRTGMDVELSWNALLAGHQHVSVVAGYWYATMHYLVTAAVLVLLWRRSRDSYLQLRRVLVAATGVALAVYIVFPTAPPRMMAGYVDVLAATSDSGWWGASASAPRGLGGLTNELAAMPSMHVGWALWSALAVISITRSPWVRLAAGAYVCATTVVVVSTANHWLLDAVVGALVTGGVWLVAVRPAPSVGSVGGVPLPATTTARRVPAPRLPVDGALLAADADVSAAVSLPR